MDYNDLESFYSNNTTSPGTSDDAGYKALSNFEKDLFQQELNSYGLGTIK